MEECSGSFLLLTLKSLIQFNFVCKEVFQLEIIDVLGLLQVHLLFYQTTYKNKTIFFKPSKQLYTKIQYLLMWLNDFKL